MLEDGLVYLLAHDSGVSALVSARIYPVQGIPDNPTYPYITYQDVTGHAEVTFSAESDVRRIQFDLWGETYSAGKTIAQAIRNALSGYTGTLNDGTRIISTVRLNYMDNFDEAARSYRSIAEYEFECAEV